MLLGAAVRHAKRLSKACSGMDLPWNVLERSRLFQGVALQIPIPQSPKPPIPQSPKPFPPTACCSVRRCVTRTASLNPAPEHSRAFEMVPACSKQGAKLGQGVVRSHPDPLSPSPPPLDSVLLGAALRHANRLSEAAAALTAAGPCRLILKPNGSKPPYASPPKPAPSPLRPRWYRSLLRLRG